MSAVVAVDIGGTKLEVGVVDESGTILHRDRASSLDAADGDDLFARLETLLRDLANANTEVELLACGVGSGGPMARHGVRVSPLNIAVWRDFPLRARLSAAFGWAVHIDNDAKALALAEAWKGAARGEENFIALVVSTGVGGGIVLDGRLLDGADGNAGHIGHIVVDVAGHDLPGHVRGVLEAEASGTAIAHHTGRPPSEASIEEIDRVGTLVGQAIGSVANLLDLRLAVIAGSVALGFGDRFFDAAQREVDRIAQLDHSQGTVVRRAGLGADGPLVGAAAVGWRGIGRAVGVR